MIDIHTHQPKIETHIQILNTFAQDLPLPENVSLYSAGLHPWHLGIVNPEKCLHSIELAIAQKNMIAVGECGLDRSIVVDFALQEYYFKKQITIAEMHCKPLIIHCVRAWSELMKLKKESKSSIPWIIHGFNGNQQTAYQLISHDFYFSIGESLLINQLKKNILTIIPTDRLFLETDDRKTSIRDIYLLAAQVLQIEEEALNELILDNFIRLFGTYFTVNNNLT